MSREVGSTGEQLRCGRVITFASAKGGTGKTILAASTAVILLHSGKRVLVVDGDFSTRGLSLFVLGDIISAPDLTVRNEQCIAEYFLSELPLSDIEPRRLDRGGIEYHILFSNADLWRSGVPEKKILSDPRIGPKHYVEGMTNLLARFRQEYDYIIVDTRGGFDFTSAVPALLADTYIMVLEPDKVSLAQIEGFEKSISEFAADYKINIPPRGFIVNKASFDPRDELFVGQLTSLTELQSRGRWG